ncbi:Fc.00g087350.m01.CDS01 [Cosmosporella sp. VM-42]
MTTDWAKLTVVDLKEELKSRGLHVAGRKAELVARLQEDDEQAQKSVEQDDAPDADDPAAPQDSPADAQSRGTPDATVDNSAHNAAPQKEPEDDAESATLSPDAVAKDFPPPRDELKEDDAPNDAPAEQPSPKEPATGQDPVSEKINEPPVDETMEDTIENTKTPEEATPMPDEAPKLATPESIQESQKRKRRSLSPPPTENTIARKRVRPDDAMNGDIAPVVRMVDEEDMPRAETMSDAMDTKEERDTRGPDPPSYETHEPREMLGREPDDYQRDMDYERDVAPAVHPATCALYIKNLMRPIRPNEIQTHLTDLATPPSEAIDDKTIINLHLDQLRTHAFVIFKSTSAASRVRTALHDIVWPDESNRKPLWVDFVPPEKVQKWIDMEESSGGGRNGARWEIVYEDGPDGNIEAFLESGATALRAGPAPSGRAPLGPATDPIPTGPRNYRDINPPTGPRPVRPGTGPGPRPPPAGRQGNFERTRTRPVIEYQKVSEELATRRIETIRSFYTSETDRDVGREINRYSFEEGDKFVDRGKEIFEGIRPPHRERAVQQERRGGRGFGGGRRGARGPGFRPRSDRYLPGLENGRDDRRDRESFRGRQGGGRRD